jgi:hypothetical protein
MFAVPFVWASMGDKDKVREIYEVLRRTGGSYAELVIVEEMFLARNYSGVANWFADPRNPANFNTYLKMSERWVAALYLRDWTEAENRLELWLDEFPIMREIFWGSPAVRENEPDLPVEVLIRSAMIGIYVAYTLKQAESTADAETVERWSEDVLNMLVARTPNSEFGLLHSSALLAATRGQTEEALTALEALFNAGWRQTMAPIMYPNDAGDLLWFEDSPILDSIRDEPRFKAVVEKVNAANAAMLTELNAGLTLEDIMDEEFD